MNRSPSRGFKLTKVIFAVIVLAVSAILSNSPVAENMDVMVEQTN